MVLQQIIENKQKNPIFIHRKIIHFTIKSWDWGHMRIDMKSKLEYYF